MIRLGIGAGEKQYAASMYMVAVTKYPFLIQFLDPFFCFYCLVISLQTMTISWYAPSETLHLSFTYDFEDPILSLNSQAMEEQMITNSIDPDVEDGENHQTTATTTYSSGLATNIALTSSIICSTSDSGPDSDQTEDNREIHITDLEAESNIKSTHSSCLQTSLASAIAKAIGHDREITEFDKLRHQLKEAKKHKKQLPGYKQLTDQHEKF